jgi:hypothetical protein
MRASGFGPKCSSTRHACAKQASMGDPNASGRRNGCLLAQEWRRTAAGGSIYLRSRPASPFGARAVGSCLTFPGRRPRCRRSHRAGAGAAVGISAHIRGTEGGAFRGGEQAAATLDFADDQTARVFRIAGWVRCGRNLEALTHESLGAHWADRLLAGCGDGRNGRENDENCQDGRFHNVG